jgi:hypothetical protein
MFHVKHFGPVAAQNLTKPKTPDGLRCSKTGQNIGTKKFVRGSAPVAACLCWNAPRCKIGFCSGLSQPEPLDGRSIALARDVIGRSFATLAMIRPARRRRFCPRRAAADGVTLDGLCAAIAPFIYKYYLGVLAQGAKPEGSIARQDYDRLRGSLAGGNLAPRLYAKWLTKFLDWIERFFGDANIADRTLFPRAFGLKKPTPLSTALCGVEHGGIFECRGDVS